MALLRTLIRRVGTWPQRAQGARPPQRALWTPWIIGLVMVLFGPGVYELGRLALQQRRLDRRLAELTAEQARLTEERHRLESDPAYVEGLIRSTFKVSRKGEFVIPLEETATQGLRR